MATLLPPLLLTGGPAAGKTVTARFLAETTPRTGYLDVDDIRQLVKNGGAAPWDGTEGKAQQVLGVRNAAALARNFAGAGFNVTITDVIDTVTPRSAGGSCRTCSWSGSRSRWTRRGDAPEPETCTSPTRSSTCSTPGSSRLWRSTRS